MRRTPLTRLGPADGWRGLLVQVSEPAVPALRVEVAPGWRLRIVQGARPILWARIAADWYGVDVRFDAPARSVLPPITAASAREMANPDEAAWIERWAHRYLDDLVEQTHPLHRGNWVVKPVTDELTRHRDVVEALVGDQHAGRGSVWLEWDIGDPPGIVPSRPLSPADDGRVKAWAKLAREGVLPPVLVWWVSGLQSYVVLDGHDRLVAAVAADVQVPVLALSGVLTFDDARRVLGRSSDVEERRQLARALRDHADDALLHEGLASAVVRAVARQEAVPRTRAWMSSAPPTTWPLD